jgi:pimeloyl-ACP methyl ester carboxylesterase
LDTYQIYFGGSYGHYARAGETGPAVVILHGWAASSKQWEWILPALASAGYTAYVLDLPGHGQAPRIPHGYAIQDHLAYLRGWMEALDIQQPTLLGHSMGGYLSLQYALQYSGMLRSLVLVDPLYSHHQFNSYHRLVQWLSSSPQALRIAEDLFRHFPMWLIEASHLWIRHDIGGAPAALRRQAALDQKRADPRIVHMIATVEDLSPHLQQLRLPALVIWGGYDHLLFPSSFETLVELLPWAQGLCFTDAGHHPHLGQTQSFVERVLTFLQHVADDRPGSEAAPAEVNQLWMSNTTTLRADR